MGQLRGGRFGVRPASLVGLAGPGPDYLDRVIRSMQSAVMRGKADARTRHMFRVLLPGQNLMQINALERFLEDAGIVEPYRPELQ